MKILKHRKTEKGFTLIELLIAMAIVGVIGSAAFSLFMFGNKIFGIGNKQYNVQSNIRLAANQLTDEIRYAVDIEILSVMNASAVSNPLSIPHYINYVYYDSALKEIVILNRNTAKHINIKPDGQLFFTKETTGDTILLTIASTDEGQVFSVDSKIYCLNIANGINKTVIGSLPGPAIKYTTNNDFISSNEAPLATVVINTPKKIEIDYSKNILSDSAITKITSQGSLNASLAVSPGRIVITLVNSPNNNSKIIYEAGLYGLDPLSYSTYVYTLSFKNGTWTLTQ